MIRCINNLEQHNSGHITVDGVELAEDLKDIAAIRRKVGMVFQHFILFPHMTVLDNCTFGLRLVLGISRAAAEEKAMSLLSCVHIAEQAQKFWTTVWWPAAARGKRPSVDDGPQGHAV